MSNEENTGLKIIGFGTLCALFGLCTTTAFRTLDIEKDIETLLERTELVLQEENVIGREAPEQFYEIDGVRIYLEVDGNPVEDYFQLLYIQE